jgi:dihydroxyacetone kinase
MLTAAVAGELFASPSVDAVLAAILTVTGAAGCLLIVKSYTGDRLNFGLAAERAKQMGLAVDMVIVEDDIALPDAPQPRGIAGTVLAHKVAGFHAEKGASLGAVKVAVEQLLERLCSLGFALATCDLPTQPHRSENSTPELGLGIHGEPGAQRVRVTTASEAVELVTERLTSALPADVPVVLLINNLGGTTPIEMDVVTRDLLNTALGQRCELLIGPAPLLTSLNMHGFSVSAVPLSPDLETALQAPVAPAAWPAASVPRSPAVVALPALGEGQMPEPEPEPRTEHFVRAICEALIASRTALDEMDARVGDGDTGATVALGAQGVLDTLDNEGLPLATPSALMAAVGRIVARSMGGSSGVLLSTFFTAAGSELGASRSMGDALQSGIHTMQHYGGARVGDRTLLDALQPATAALSDSSDLAAAAQAAREGAENTCTLERAGAGRSAYLRADSLAGHADPGAVAVAIVFEALADC